VEAAAGRAKAGCALAEPLVRALPDRSAAVRFE